MKRTVVNALAAGALLLVTSARAAVTVDAPHSSYTCSACHTVHNDPSVTGATAYNNICLSCHRPDVPTAENKPFTLGDEADPYGTHNDNQSAGRYQHSHRWSGSDTVPAAGAVPPVQAAMTTGNLRGRTDGQLACIRCHNQHSNTYGKFLRAANDQDQLCLDCHRSRNTSSHATGSHPVGITYANVYNSHTSNYRITPQNSNPANASSAMKLVGGKVLCSTCHGMHYTDSNSSTTDSAASYNSLAPADGNLLRTDLRGASADGMNICTNCHTGKLAHNFRGQNVQCTDCHGGHVNPGDGSTPNVWLVKRQMQFSSTLRSTSGYTVAFTSTASKNYMDLSKVNSRDNVGVCQVCHDVPTGAGFQFHLAESNATCNNCHTHGNRSQGSFSVDPARSCNSCHGFPPSRNIAGSGGYASGYSTKPSFTNESTSGHKTHASSPYQKACTECHAGSSHASGNYQQVFLSTAGSVAATGGLTPSYNSTAQTCSSVYCHSNAAPRGGTMVTSTTPSWSKADGGGLGSIVGRTGECGFCHSRAGDTNPTWSASHTRHINGYAANPGFTCATCHSDTAESNSSLVTGSAARALHTDGHKEVVYAASGPAAGGGFDPATASCTVYCHSTVQGANGQGSGTNVQVTWNGSAMNCGSCHANLASDSANATGNHRTHAITHGYACSVCHGSGYTATAVVTATHVDKVINIGFAFPATANNSSPYYYSPTYVNTPGSGYTTCSNTYCHSTVQGTGGNSGGITYASPTWGGAAISCGNCHVNMSTSANATGSHISHSQTLDMTCDLCHKNAGYATSRHANGRINLSFSGSAAGSVYSNSSSHLPGLAHGSCTNSRCHGTTVSSPTWGSSTGKPQCEKCHGYRNSGWNALNGATATSDAKAGTHFTHISSSGTARFSRSFSCSECHLNSIALASNSVDAAGHFDTASPAEVAFGAIARTGSLNPTYASGTCSNTYCHGKSLTSNTTPPAGVNLSPVWNVPFLTGTASNDCGKCHGYPPASSVHTGATTNCSNCHGHLNSAGNGFTDVSLHVNGIIEADGHAFPYSGAAHMSSAGTTPWSSCVSSSCHTNGSNSTYPVAAGVRPDCTGCHINGLRAPSGSSSCWDCHGVSATDGRPNGSTFPNIDGSHTKHTGLTCAICHSGHGTGTTTHGSSNRTASTQAKAQSALSFSGVAAANSTSATSCATTWCHGGNTTLIPQNSPARTAPVWGTPFPTGSALGTGGSSGTSGTGFCAQCHGYPPRNALHAGKTAGLCTSCHPHLNSDALTFNDSTKHVNGTIDASGGHTFPYPGSAHLGEAGTTPWGSCVTSGCHANGSNSTYPVAAGTAPDCRGCHVNGLRAPSGSSSCWDCHGASATDGLPNGSTFPNIAGSHAVHGSLSGVTCAICHSGHGTGTTTHGSSNRTASTQAKAQSALSFSGVAAANSTSATSCATTWCHGGNTALIPQNSPARTAPVWGTPFPTGSALGTGGSSGTSGTGFCAQCHGYPPRNALHAGKTSGQCTSCHPHLNGDALTFNDSTKHVNGTIDASGGHEFPYPGSAHLSEAGTTPWGSCVTSGCHANGSNSTYPVASGTAPDCTGCHVNGLKVPSGSSSCWDCHGVSATNGRPNGSTFPNIDGSHTSHTGLTCAICHSGHGTGTATHGSSNRTASTQAKAQSALSFSGVAAANSTSATSCATTWCHGGNTTLIPQNSPARTAPVWGTPFPTGSTLGTGGSSGTSGTGFCAQCHGYPPRNALHAGKTAGQCTSCHPHLNSDALTFNDSTKHVNGTIDASSGHVFPYSGSAHLSEAGTTPWGSCVTSGCHANGSNSTYPVAAGTAPDCRGCHVNGLRAPSGSSSCWDCHGASATDGLPNGSSFPNIAGSHAVHGSLSGVTCAVCHSGGGTGSSAHGSSNRTAATGASVNVLWNFANSSFQFSWTAATATCTNIACHTVPSQTSSAAIWGDSGCSVCHTATTAVPVFMSGNWDTLKGTRVGKIVTSIWATSGHGRSSGNYPVSGNPAANLTCEHCHDPAEPHQSASGPNPMRLRNINDATWGLNGVCQTCHAHGGTTVTIGTLPGVPVQTMINSYHKGAKHLGLNNDGGQWCWDCHNPHGSSNRYMIGSQVARNSNPGGDPESGYLMTATFTAASTGSDYVATANSICRTCHSATGHYTRDNTDSHNIGIRCTTCHSHNGPSEVDAFQPTEGHAFPYPGSTHSSAAGSSPYGACTGCHDTAAGGTYPVASGTAPNCTGCHLNAANFNSGSAGCADCHGTNANGGRPNGSSFPNRQGEHSKGDHQVACTTCHTFTAGDSRHGWSNGTKSTNAQLKATLNWSTANGGTCNPQAGGFSGCHGSKSGWY